MAGRPRLLYVEHSPEGNRVPPLEGNGESLEQKYGQVVPCTGSLNCHWN